MRSRIPKVLHPLAGKTLLTHVFDTVRGLQPAAVAVVLGHAGDQVRQHVPPDVSIARQGEQLGTGDAVRSAQSALPEDLDRVLVVYGDTALVRAETLQRVLDALDVAPASMLTGRLDNPFGYGRVFRNAQGRVEQLIEEAELTADQKQLDEVSCGVFAFRAPWLWDQLPRLARHPNGEYYLTDLMNAAADEGAPGVPILLDDPREGVGINDRQQLADAHGIVYERVRRRLLLDVGVSMPQPESVFVEPGVEVGPDTLLLPNTYLRGATRVGRDCTIGPNTELVDTQVGDGCQVAWSVLEGGVIRDRVHIGPFCHLRPGATLETDVHLGNFVEVKNSVLGAASHAGHFSYIGDAELGQRVNVGAGTVTCNFDGRTKSRTVIGDDAFIGSDTMLVAPVTLGAGVRTGAGSVVTRDVESGQLVVGVPARVVPGHARDGVASQQRTQAVGGGEEGA
jgi:bifunctional UDP-N-acetylglucosamine pyrophosphorylase / glucosamine-1-phosphate N-acetyltransferase